MISSDSRPGRRPVNRKRENAYAANVERASENSVAKPAMMIELTNQLVNAVRSNRAWKFTVLAPFGIRAVELSVPSGLNAADTTERIGNRAKTQAPSATRWRQPTRENHD